MEVNQIAHLLRHTEDEGDEEVVELREVRARST